MSRQTVCIHGFGLAGRRAYNFYRFSYKVVAFIDSDPSLHTNKSMPTGLPVIGPKHPLAANADKILIASMHAHAILKEYEDLGLDYKTWVVPQSVRNNSAANLNFVTFIIILYLLSPPILIILLFLG